MNKRKNNWVVNKSCVTDDHLLKFRLHFSNLLFFFSPILTILVSFYFIITSSVLFYLNRLLSLDFLWLERHIEKTASFILISLIGHVRKKRCVTTQVMSVKLYLDPAFYHSVFLKFLFLTIANELYCVTSSDWLSLDHAVKNLALTQRGFTWERVILTCGT